MNIIFDVADRISVLVYGEIIATDEPKKFAPTPRFKKPISARCTVLKVSDLHAFYGKSHILQGVNFHVAEGEIVSLLGRNGVGRSTTVKTIMGEVEPQGSIQFKGKR